MYQGCDQFLSSALNEIAGDIFLKVDIDLNLNSYSDFQMVAIHSVQI
jgi:hypothetical protein